MYPIAEIGDYRSCRFSINFNGRLFDSDRTE